MTTYDLGPARPTNRPSEPTIQVRIDEDLVVVRLGTAIDRDATNALVDTMNAAIAAGCSVMLELDRVVDGAFLATSSGVQQAVQPTQPDIAAIGSGLIGIPTVTRPWTIDVVRRRLCTATVGAERRFVPPAGWTPIRSCCVSAGRVLAVGASGQDLVRSAARGGRSPAAAPSR